MGGYILCQTKKAKVPYFIENISTNIYSLEELCYYLYHNLYLVDKTIINENLCNWIQKELDLPKLAAKLRPCVGKFASAEDILYPVFKEINYLTYEELKALNTQIQKLDSEPVPVREKHKGDSLVENGMYVNAIHVYEKLLERDDLKDAGAELAGEVWYNLGCAYSYLFQMEKALECFWKACENGGGREALKTYLICYFTIHTQEEYENRVKELGVEKELADEVHDTLVKFTKVPRQEVEPQRIDAMIEEFMKEYHRSTGS